MQAGRSNFLGSEDEILKREHYSVLARHRNHAGYQKLNGKSSQNNYITFTKDREANEDTVGRKGIQTLSLSLFYVKTGAQTACFWGQMTFTLDNWLSNEIQDPAFWIDWIYPWAEEARKDKGWSFDVKQLKLIIFKIFVCVKHQSLQCSFCRLFCVIKISLGTKHKRRLLLNKITIE